MGSKLIDRLTIIGTMWEAFMENIPDEGKEQVTDDLLKLHIGDSYQVSTAELSTFTYKVVDSGEGYPVLDAWLH